MDLSSRPVGLFDSGVGGLSILTEVHDQLPDEDLIYIADQEWAPYGSRSIEEVRDRSVAIAAELIGRGCKVVVVACNSASAAALQHLRHTFPDTPFVGMEPALKPAAELTDRGVIGVLATATTFQGELYASVLDRHANGVEVHAVAGERLAMLVEEGRLDEAKGDLELLLRPMLDAGIDTLVLGCTHYPFLDSQIRAVAGPDIRLIDPAPAVARQLRRVLDEADLRNSTLGAGGTVYLTSGGPGHLEDQAASLIGYTIAAVRVDIEDQGTR
ncbi:MAG: glutamate racemase [bacterium]|nr:glutamate racemase [bacterium]